MFLPAYETSTHAFLTDVFDGQGYDERRRHGPHKGRVEIPNAHLSLMAGTTPEYLANMLPDGAWAEGFMSRVILVYSGAQPVTPLFEQFEEADRSLRAGSRVRPSKISDRVGPIRWDEDAYCKFNRWYTTGRTPVPSHPKLSTYLTRRHYHLIKLTEIFCLSRGGETLNTDDYESALDMLLETEQNMTDAFKAMRTGGDQSAIRDAFHYVFSLYAKQQKPVRRAKLVLFLSERVAFALVDRIVQLMESANMLKRRTCLRLGYASSRLGRGGM